MVDSPVIVMDEEEKAAFEAAVEELVWGGLMFDGAFEDPEPAQGDDDTSTWGLKAVKALEARATYGIDGTGVVVGILDTGFAADHPLLEGKL